MGFKLPSVKQHFQFLQSLKIMPLKRNKTEILWAQVKSSLISQNEAYIAGGVAQILG